MTAVTFCKNVKKRGKQVMPKMFPKLQQNYYKMVQNKSQTDSKMFQK